MSDHKADTEIIRHWGVQFHNGLVRWDPGYGSGIYIPYTEDEARADARQNHGEVVTRLEITTVTTTDWEIAP